MRLIDGEKRIIELLSSLVAVASPYFHEEAVMEVAYDWLKQNQLAPDYHRYQENKITKFSGCNVIGRIKGSKPGPHIHLNGHLDTVEQCDGWQHDPLKLTREDDRLYGLGALDMKGGCAAIMLALADFRGAHPDFAGTIDYSFVSDEEGPYGLGTDALINEGLIKGDLVLIPEPSASFCQQPFPCLALGARGGISYQVTLTGQAAHAACPEQGVSAIEDAAALICQLKQSQLPADEKLGTGSVCVLEIGGGGAACSVADKAWFRVYRHIVRGETEDSLRQELAQAAAQAGIIAKYTMEFRPAPGEDNAMFYPYVVDEATSWTQKLTHSIETAVNNRVNNAYFNSIGDFNSIAVRTGIPTYVFGPGGGNFHAPDEYVDLPSLLATSQAIRQLLEDCLG